MTKSTPTKKPSIRRMVLDLKQGESVSFPLERYDYVRSLVYTPPMQAAGRISVVTNNAAGTITVTRTK
ncbi:MAG: hypothetical protein LIP02_11325 [Bacteroidales bacterium]|nr:hypothetical protein [Bacteroidales bacterium]